MRPPSPERQQWQTLIHWHTVLTTVRSLRGTVIKIPLRDSDQDPFGETVIRIPSWDSDQDPFRGTVIKIPSWDSDQDPFVGQ